MLNNLVYICIKIGIKSNVFYLIINMDNGHHDSDNVSFEKETEVLELQKKVTAKLKDLTKIGEKIFNEKFDTSD